jgi:hypothetical protein
VYVTDVRHRLGLSQSSATHIAAKHGVEIKVDRQKRHWVDPAAFDDAYEANGNPEASVEGLIKVSDLAIQLGYSRSTIVTICAELRITTAKLRTRGNQGYLTPEQAAQVAARRRKKPGVPKGTRLTITPAPRPTPGPALAPTPAKNQITAMEQQAVNLRKANAQFLAEQDRHPGKTVASKEPQLKPVDPVDGWRKELQAARKRGTAQVAAAPQVTTKANRQGHHNTASKGLTCQISHTF